MIPADNDMGGDTTTVGIGAVTRCELIGKVT